MDSLLIKKNRIQSLDLLRGIVMIIMALDHVRDYFYIGSFTVKPTDLTHTTVALFATRWITHYCAPVFVLLAGTSAFLSGQKKTRKELSFFLLTRGLWLIFLELTLIAMAWKMQIDFHHIFLAVIWALGACMIALSVLIWLPLNGILITGLILIIFHNTLDTVHISGNSAPALLWKLLHEEGSVTLGETKIQVVYPILPWIGVMALGYCMGKLYTTGFDSVKRKKTLAITGLSAIIFFLILRFTNLYGDMSLWSNQPDPVFTVLSFLNVTKYPPSLLYLAMTLGPALLFLSVSENLSNRITAIITVYGRVPMFYYICHLYMIQFSAALLFFSQGFKLSDLEKGIPSGYGVNLVMTWGVWMGLVTLLYPLCKWYDRYKSGHPEKKWLSYL